MELLTLKPRAIVPADLTNKNVSLYIIDLWESDNNCRRLIRQIGELNETN